MAEVQASEAMTAPAADLQLAIRSAPEPSIAIDHTVRPAFRLMDLPVEWQDLVLEYPILNSDIKSACLACKRFETFLTPLLYRHMEVDGDYVRDESFARSLTGNHHGLKHVRTMCVCDPRTLVEFATEAAKTRPPTEIPEEKVVDEKTSKAICHLLGAMPKHSLTRFELPMYYCQGTEIERTIRLTQRALTNYQFRDNGLNVLRTLAQPGAGDLALITNLQLYLQYDEDYDHAFFLLESTPNLVSLDIESLMDQPDTVFPLTPLTAGPRKSLRIECFRFDEGGTTFFNIVRFEELEKLQLFHCNDYGLLLLEFAHLPLKLKSFAIDERDQRDPRFDDNTNVFLRSLKPLERISLALDPDISYSKIIPPDFSALAVHASTLKYLRVECHEFMKVFPTESSITAFERFCESAVNLEQLAISGIYACFLYDADPGIFYIPRFIDSIGKFRSLRVLKVSGLYFNVTGPDDPPDGTPRSRSQLDARSIKRRREMQVLVNRMFYTNELVYLDLAAIFLVTNGPEDEDKAIYHFLRSQPMIDEDGDLAAMGLPTKFRTIKYHEPCLEILGREDFGLTKIRSAYERRKRSCPWVRDGT